MIGVGMLDEAGTPLSFSSVDVVVGRGWFVASVSTDPAHNLQWKVSELLLFSLFFSIYKKSASSSICVCVVYDVVVTVYSVRITSSSPAQRMRLSKDSGVE